MTFRIGHGFDIHRLRAGGRLLLGGVVVSDEISAVAHSDGDVAIHAIVDALLGACGKGDIGEHFPDSDPKWKGALPATFLFDGRGAKKQSWLGSVTYDDLRTRVSGLLNRRKR